MFMPELWCSIDTTAVRWRGKKKSEAGLNEDSVHVIDESAQKHSGECVKFKQCTRISMKNAE